MCILLVLSVAPQVGQQHGDESPEQLVGNEQSKAQGDEAIAVRVGKGLTAVSGFVTDLTWLTPAQTLAGLLQGQQTVATQSLHSFLYAVLAGITANYISCNWIAHSMMRSLTKYPALRDPVLYGGVRHD